MGMGIFRRCTTAVLAALLVGAGGVVAVAPAHAGQDDDEFIELLDLDGVPYSNRTDVIRAAKEYCLASSRPRANPWRVADQMAEDMKLSPSEAQEFGRAARRAYCPS